MAELSSVKICDPHHHFWQYPGNVYLPEDLQNDFDGLSVDKTVYVECRSAYFTGGPESERPVGETAWVRELAERGGRVAGIVGFADLTLGAAVEPVLHQHIDAGGGLFRGIRHATAWHADERIRRAHTSPPPELFRDAEFREGFATIAPAGLTFDAWLYFPQLPELVELARAFSETIIVVNHLGGPLGVGPYEGARDEMLAEWRRLMTEAVRCENVLVKLGGIGSRLHGFGWHRRDVPVSADEIAAAWAPEVRWVIDQFGVDRCMFESNFPVDKLSFTYRTVWEAFALMTDDCSGPERGALFHDTAVRTYRL